jgi:hypothetical protein
MLQNLHMLFQLIEISLDRPEDPMSVGLSIDDVRTYVRCKVNRIKEVTHYRQIYGIIVIILARFDCGIFSLTTTVFTGS